MAGIQLSRDGQGHRDTRRNRVGHRYGKAGTVGRDQLGNTMTHRRHRLGHREGKTGWDTGRKGWDAGKERQARTQLGKGGTQVRKDRLGHN